MSLQWSAILASLIIIPLLYSISRCIYNLFFHPLRHYPGPLLARATRLYNIYYDIQGLWHHKVKEAHDKYGHVVRIAPNELTYTSGRAWRDIYGHRSRDRPGSFEKDPGFFNLLGNNASHIILANDADHRRFRRLQSHAFSEKALKAQEGIIQTHVNTLMMQLHRRSLSSTKDTVEANDNYKGIVDIVQWYNFATFDIIGDLAFGSAFGCLESGTRHRWIEVVFQVLKSGTYMRSARRFPSPLHELLLLLVPKKLMDDRKYQFIFTAKKVKDRLDAGVTERADFMSYILRENGEEKGMTVEELQVGAQVFIIAGSETSATALSGTTYLLLRNRETLEKLIHEIRTSFKTETDINMQNTANLPYLHAVLQEALRMYPPAPNSFPRATPEPGQVICGQFVPAGTAVGVHQWSAHRSRRNFRDPDEFHPERWLGDERYKDDHLDAMQAFSHGPRNCLGMNLAYAEMRIILCRWLWNFDLDLQSDSRNWIDKQKTYNLWEKEPLNVKLVAVDRSS